MTIAAKLRTAFILSIAIAVAAFIVIMFQIRSTRIQQNVDRTGAFLHHITDRDKEELANEIFDNRIDAIRLRIGKIAEIPGLYSVVIYDENRLGLVGTDGYQGATRMELAEDVPDIGYVLERIFSLDPPTLRFTKGINVIGERLGYIQIYYSLDTLLREIILEFITLTALVILIPVSIFIFLFLFFRASIMKPIEELQNTMARVVEEGPGITAHIEQRDEIGDLAKSFNNMSGELKTSYNEITRQKEELRKTLGEREILIHDIHHRVKNNLAVIQSLISLEQSMIEDKKPDAVQKYREAFEKLNVRVFVISSIYNHLYQTNSPVNEVDCKEFFETLVNKLADLHNTAELKVSFKILIDPLILPLNITIPLALIINEIVSNSYKHAFISATSGSIFLDIKDVQGELVISVGDDGSGFPADYMKQKETSLGIQLIDLLSSQIQAETSVTTTRGVSYTFRIKDFHGTDYSG